MAVCALIGKVGRRWLMGISYFITNGLLIGLLLELGHMMFRVVAFWMVILLFVMYAALVTFILYLCCAVLWHANRFLEACGCLRLVCGRFARFGDV